MVTNACGTTTKTGAAFGAFEIIGETGEVGNPVTGTSGTEYRTYQFPGDLGTWIVDAMREEPYSCAAPAEKDALKWGHYYAPELSDGACPGGWRLPFADEALNMIRFARTLPNGNIAKEALWNRERMQGIPISSSNCTINYNNRRYIRINNYDYVGYAGYMSPDAQGNSWIYSNNSGTNVLCVKK
jgi:hypothetical protein